MEERVEEDGGAPPMVAIKTPAVTVEMAPMVGLLRVSLPVQYDMKAEAGSDENSLPLAHPVDEPPVAQTAAFYNNGASSELKEPLIDNRNQILLINSCYAQV